MFDRFLTKDKNMNNIFLYYLDNDIHIIIEFQVTNVNMQTSKTQLFREGRDCPLNQNQKTKENG